MSIVKFSDVAHRANTKEDRFNTDKIYYVGGEHIDSNELFVISKGIIKGSTIGPMFYCGFTSGQILFVTRNPHLRKCGIVDFDGICSEKTFVIESKDTTKLSQEYLAIIMQSDEFWNYCEENKSGGVNYFLNWSTLADYEFELPPIQIQEEIAEKVMSAYRLKQSYQKLLTATDEMVKSQFIEMFGNVGETRSLCEICRPKQWPTIPTKDFTEDGYFVYGANGVIGHYSEYNHEHPTILMACRGASCGAINISQPKSYITGNAMCMDEVIPDISFEYLAYYLSNYDYKTIITGGAQPQITYTNLKKVMVPIPSYNDQQSFALIYKQADKSKFELRKSIEAIDAVIKNLING